MNPFSIVKSEGHMSDWFIFGGSSLYQENIYYKNIFF